MAIHITDLVQATEAEQVEVLKETTEWAYRRAPLVYALCVIERCHCGNVLGDPYAWAVAFLDRVTLYNDDGEVIGSYDSVQGAADAYAKAEECMVRTIPLHFDPAHRDPDPPFRRVRMS